ncbi:MAG: hypothetical protein RL131_191 [Bacteroidota bacterium]|jgi:drug/metabolite transporter (DMT)-like permease
MMKLSISGSVGYIGVGLVFAILWASASTVTKIGLQQAQPFVISVVRFFMASALMLIISHLLMKNPLPKHEEFKKLAIYGLLNITIYLGLYILAMQEVSAGLGSLAVAINPVIITLLSGIWDRKKINLQSISSLLLCTSGVLIAAYPLIKNSFASPLGILLLFTSMLIYSLGTIYFERNNWQGLPLLTINGWQTFFGGVFIAPIAFFTWDAQSNVLDKQFWITTSWLAIGVSIMAIQCWIFLLKTYGGKSSYWLFLCPIVGFILSNSIMNEPIGVFTFVGSALVLFGLYGNIKNRFKAVKTD